MKYDVPFRITVTDPPIGVLMKVQNGRGAFLEPEMTGTAFSFEFDVRVDLSGNAPNFLGPFAHGPKTARFVYVNSGRQAGQFGSCWDRRAKLSLMSISKETVEKVVSSKTARLEAVIQGTGRDGGPVCASIKELVWRIAAK